VPLNPILTEINAVQTLTFSFFQFNFSITLPFTPRPSMFFLALNLENEFFYAFLIFYMHAALPAII